MSDTELHLHTDGLDGMGKRFVEAWHDAEAGRPVAGQHHVTFETMEQFATIMTSKRVALLRYLHGNGPMSVRALAAAIGRDYKTVHTDVARLEAAGVIERLARDRVSVPWRTLSSQLDLAA